MYTAWTTPRTGTDEDFWKTMTADQAIARRTPVSVADNVSLVGMKWAILLRLSASTRMASFPEAVRGKSVTRSRLT